MNVPGVAWVALILLLIPVIQQWIAMQWPESSYAITALIVGVLAAVGKWLQMYMQPAQPQILPMPDAAFGAMSTPQPEQPKQPSKVKTWLIG